MNDKIHETSSEIYHVDPNEIRKLGLEKMKKNRGNCYKSHKECKNEEERQKRWDELIKNIKENGFLDKYPIQIMINRNDDNKDQIYQGHHRLAIAIELKIPKVPVRFLTKLKTQPISSFYCGSCFV